MIEWLRVPLGPNIDARLFLSRWPTQIEIDCLIENLRIAREGAPKETEPAP